MDLPTLQIHCIKCAASTDLDVAGMRKEGADWQPVNARRPSGWIAGPADPNDPLRGLCPGCAAEWQDATNKFLTSHLPPPPEPARRHSVMPAKCDPVANTTLDHVEASTRAPLAPPRPLGMNSIPTAAIPMHVPKIMPMVGLATGGYGAAYPPPLPSKPITKVFNSSSGPTVTPTAFSPAEPVMAVQTKTSPLPNHIDCTPSGSGDMQPVAHDYGRSPARKMFSSNEVTLAPFTPVKP